MKEENKKRINKLVIPFTRRTLSFLTATTMIVTGTTGCKEVDNNENTSSIIISDDDISSEESIIVDTEDTTTSEITSEEVTTEIEQNNVSSNVSSEDKNNNPVVSNNENTTSTPSASTPSTELPEKPIEKPVETPDTPSTPEVTMPEKLTVDNINDVEIFKHFATKFQRSSYPGEIGMIFQYNYNGETYYTLGDTEFQVALFLLNYQHVNKELYNSLFGNYSDEEMKRFANFLLKIPFMVPAKNAKYDFENLCVDNNLGKFLSEFTGEYRIIKEQMRSSKFEDMMEKYFVTKNQPYYYGSGNCFADCYIWSLSCDAQFYVYDRELCNHVYNRDGIKECIDSIDNALDKFISTNKTYIKE